MGNSGSRDDDEDDDYDNSEYDPVNTSDSSPPRPSTRVPTAGDDDDDSGQESGEEGVVRPTRPRDEAEKTSKRKQRRRRKGTKPVPMGNLYLQWLADKEAVEAAAAKAAKDSGQPVVAAPLSTPTDNRAGNFYEALRLKAEADARKKAPPPRPPRPAAADVTAALQPIPTDEEKKRLDMCCGSQCAACCGCPTDEAACWMRSCNHRDHVRSYLGNLMLTDERLSGINCVLLAVFFILWGIEDTSTESSVAKSWNSHIVFAALYAILAMGAVVSVYQQVSAKYKNKTYVWSALWFAAFLTSVVFFRQARDQQLDDDPLLFRMFRYTAWLLLLFTTSFAGIMHTFHLFSNKFKDVAKELQDLSMPGAIDPAPSSCQSMCGPKESIGVYLSSMGISKEGVFIPVFLLFELFLVGKFFDDVSPTTISGISSFENGVKVHAICMPLYVAIGLLMITSLVDAIVQKRIAHIWAFCFWAAIGSGIAMIRHSNIHANDEDRLDFDALRISGWVTLGTAVELIFILHTVRLTVYKPLVDQLEPRPAFTLSLSGTTLPA